MHFREIDMTVLTILGHRLKDDGSMTDILKSRLDSALKIIPTQITEDDRIMLCGGIANPEAGIAEATVMKQYLVEKGVNPDLIILEAKSLTTKENAKFGAVIIKELGAKEVMICTSDYHMYRWYRNPLKLFRHYLGRDYEILPVVAIDPQN